MSIVQRYVRGYVVAVLKRSRGQSEKSSHRATWYFYMIGSSILSFFSGGSTPHVSFQSSRKRTGNRAVLVKEAFKTLKLDWSFVSLLSSNSHNHIQIEPCYGVNFLESCQMLLMHVPKGTKTAFDRTKFFLLRQHTFLTPIGIIDIVFKRFNRVKWAASEKLHLVIAVDRRSRPYYSHHSGLSFILRHPKHLKSCDAIDCDPWIQWSNHRRHGTSSKKHQSLEKAMYVPGNSVPWNDDVYIPHRICQAVRCIFYTQTIGLAVC